MTTIGWLNKSNDVRDIQDLLVLHASILWQEEKLWQVLQTLFQPGHHNNKVISLNKPSNSGDRGMEWKIKIWQPGSENDLKKILSSEGFSVQNYGSIAVGQ